MQTRSTLEVPPAVLHVGIYEITRLCVSTNQPWLLLGSSLLCCPSTTAQALRAAMVAAELPLRGKLRTEATIFSTDPLILEVFYQCLQALFVQDLSYPGGPELPRARRMGKTVVPDRACSARCLPPTSNPAARAARAVPRPTNFSKRGASRRQAPICRVSHYC